MGENSAIEWTKHSFNPWWGCVKVASGCANCYAESFSRRWDYDVWGAGKERRTFGDKHWREPIKWNRRARENGRQDRVFCGSMCDVFELHPNPGQNRILNDERARLWDLIEETPALIWMLLTKRPENIQTMLPARWIFGDLPKNVWFGYSASTQDDFDRGWPVMEAFGYFHHPAVIFLSLEPLLGPIDLSDWSETTSGYADEFCCERAQRGIDWIAAGCESGAHRRRSKTEWFRLLRDTGIPFFLKQMEVGGRIVKMPLLDGRRWDQMPNAETTRTICPDCGASIPDDGSCWYCENDPARVEAIQ